MIQDGIRSGRFELAWSYVLDFENENNPFEERKAQIEKWKLLSIMDTEETVDVLNHAKDLAHLGIKKLDALHVSCAIFSGCDFFITTDDKVLKKNPLVKGIEIVDPFSFIKETEN
ncbi:MAG: PIN domain protein [Thermodesulfobacteriota bacterium]